MSDKPFRDEDVLFQWHHYDGVLFHYAAVGPIEAPAVYYFTTLDPCWTKSMMLLPDRRFMELLTNQSAALAARDKTIEQQAKRIADLEAKLDKYREAAECGRNRQKNGKMAQEVLQRLQTALDFDKRAKKEEKPNRPTIICLCGSTRFMDAFFEAGWRATLEGKIVLSVGVCKHARDHGAETLGQDVADRLDELHLRKIDLADEVLILNVGGYIGQSTRRELEYAKAHGKPVSYLEPIEEAPDAPQA